MSNQVVLSVNGRPGLDPAIPREVHLRNPNEDPELALVSQSHPLLLVEYSHLCGHNMAAMVSTVSMLPPREQESLLVSSLSSSCSRVPDPQVSW